MQAATVVLAQRALEEGKLTRFQAQVSYERLCFVIFFNCETSLIDVTDFIFTIPCLQEVFEEALEQLREAIGILQVEPDGKEELQEQMKNLSRILTDLDDEE